jgi:hypothetical protein
MTEKMLQYIFCLGVGDGCGLKIICSSKLSVNIFKTYVCFEIIHFDQGGTQHWPTAFTTLGPHKSVFRTTLPQSSTRHRRPLPASTGTRPPRVHLGLRPKFKAMRYAAALRAAPRTNCSSGIVSTIH